MRKQPFFAVSHCPGPPLASQGLAANTGRRGSEVPRQGLPLRPALNVFRK